MHALRGAWLVPQVAHLPLQPSRPVRCRQVQHACWGCEGSKQHPGMTCLAALILCRLLRCCPQSDNATCAVEAAGRHATGVQGCTCTCCSHTLHTGVPADEHSTGACNATGCHAMHSSCVPCPLTPLLMIASGYFEQMDTSDRWVHQASQPVPALWAAAHLRDGGNVLPRVGLVHRQCRLLRRGRATQLMSTYDGASGRCRAGLILDRRRAAAVESALGTCTEC